MRCETRLTSCNASRMQMSAVHSAPPELLCQFRKRRHTGCVGGWGTDAPYPECKCVKSRPLVSCMWHLPQSRSVSHPLCFDWGVGYVLCHACTTLHTHTHTHTHKHSHGFWEHSVCLSGYHPKRQVRRSEATCFIAPSTHTLQVIA